DAYAQAETVPAAINEIGAAGLRSGIEVGVGKEAFITSANIARDTERVDVIGKAAFNRVGLGKAAISFFARLVRLFYGENAFFNGFVDKGVGRLCLSGQRSAERRGGCNLSNLFEVH